MATRAGSVAAADPLNNSAVAQAVDELLQRSYAMAKHGRWGSLEVVLRWENGRLCWWDVNEKQTHRVEA